ncbi:MAG: glycosyltransferase [Minisyncoccia bacterium]
MRQNGVCVIECRVDPKRHRGWAKYRALLSAARAARREKIDFVLVAFPGHTLVWLARVLFLRHSIVFDAFLSLYDSNVFDRKTHRKGSTAALMDWLLDFFGCHLPGRVLLDTDAHIDYFVRTFGVRREKFLRVWIGADTAVFPRRAVALPEPFTVHFHGSFIPLQGVEYILEAAALLKGESIRFRLVGEGQQFRHMRARAEALGLTNTEFVGRVPLSSVADYVAASHLCLGIFGDTDKTARVIPNKVFECVAMGKPVITADTPAIRELEVYGPLPLILVPRADARALATAIRALMRDPARCAALGRDAAAFFDQHLSARDIGRELMNALCGNAPSGL